MQVLGDPGPALLLGLLVEQGVRDVGGHARADAGQGQDQQHAGHVRHESGGQQGDAREGEREGEHPAPGQGRHQQRRGTDADDHAAGQRAHHQAEEHGPTAQVLGVQHRHGDGGRHRAGHGRAREHQQRQRAGAALVGSRGASRAAQALQRRARAGRAGAGQVQEGDDGQRRGEQSRRDVRGERRLVLAEPLDPRAQQVVAQGGDDERQGGERYRDEAGAQGQPAQGVHVVGQRPDAGALGRRSGQQGGRGALAAHRPEPLGDAGHERGDQEDRQGVVRGPVDPQRRHDEQRGPQSVRADHGPAAVQGPVLGGE